MELGEIKNIDIRKKWKNESSDFTPWLAENIDIISKKLNLDLEVKEIEANAGSFSADILAKDNLEDKYVIIENQLEKTDHDHLGKSITYASILDASTIIWIASKFTDEHKKALEWLNNLTNEDISFYGLELELLQIDDSNPAINFDIISEPNQTVRRTRKTVTGEISELGKNQIEFWDDFKKKVSSKKKDIRLQKSSDQNWFDISIGKSYIHVFNTYNQRDNEVTSGIYIKNKITEDMFPFLENKKETIEENMGEQLIWDPNPNAKSKKIMLSYNKTDLRDNEGREEALEWLSNHAIKFVEVFSPIIKSFK